MVVKKQTRALCIFVFCAWAQKRLSRSCCRRRRRWTAAVVAVCACVWVEREREKFQLERRGEKVEALGEKRERGETRARARLRESER